MCGSTPLVFCLDNLPRFNKLNHLKIILLSLDSSVSWCIFGNSYLWMSMWTSTKCFFANSGQLVK
ncbi:hypothetical protein AMTR_s00019p00167930 [Amborella trichopoda]|uniref:Uncharacterized protein n=1 Tax=Amborella trichopoda TaxID=13333 RepID=W1PBC4_AMBTC|nr:hypothetical protein AMTR_s00019p00167930 [Amborella trichopoda]